MTHFLIYYFDKSFHVDTAHSAKSLKYHCGEWLSMGSDIPVLDGDLLNEREQAVLGGFIKESGYVDDATKFIQCEVPVGLQRLYKAISRVEGEERNPQTDRSHDEATAQREYSDIPRGLMSSRDMSPQEGSAGNIDAVVVKEDKVQLVELKGEVQGLNDTHQGFGQLLLYREMFKEDYPSMMDEASLSLSLVTGEWNVAPELVGPTYRMKSIGVFEASGSRWVVETGKGELPQSEVMDVNPDMLKNYDVPLAMAMGGTIEDLAKARKVMDNIEPYADLDPGDFEQFDSPESTTL